MSERARRHAELRRLIGARRLRSHVEVRAALAESGLDVHPATISRDLEELGARKVRGEDGQLAYRITDVAVLPSDALDEVLRRFVVDVDASGNLAVLRTPPACAHPVASAIDRAGIDDVIATVAGDDTVLVVAADGCSGATIARRLAARLGLVQGRATDLAPDHTSDVAPDVAADRTDQPARPATPIGARRGSRSGTEPARPDRQGA